MLGLVAAQLKYRTQAGLITKKPVWVDVSIETPHDRRRNLTDLVRSEAGPDTSEIYLIYSIHCILTGLSLQHRTNVRISLST